MTNLTSFIFSHSHHLLKVKDCDDVLDVLAFEGKESLSQPFSYHIEFTSSHHFISREDMLMKPASLTLQAPVDYGFGRIFKEPVRIIHGVVTGFKRLRTSKDETHYALTLEPRLALLSRSHQNAIYQDKSVPQIVEKILRERHNMRGQDFLFSLVHDYPRREQVMQYGETDLQFISRLLSEVGIWFRFTSDTRLDIDVVEFYDSREGYESGENGLTLPSVPLSGLHSQGVDSVWGMSSHHNVVEKSVTLNDYNYRQATDNLSTTKDITIDDHTTYGEAYHYADNYLTQGSHYDRFPEVESGAFYARLRHERYLNQQTQLSGITSSPTLHLGKVLKVWGGVEVEPTFVNGVVITQMNLSARRDKDFEVQFHALPDSSEICYRAPLIARPVMAGTLPARVSSTKKNDMYGHIDRDGRYRVNILFDRDSWEQGYESLLVRQSRPYGGDTYGLHLPLLAGTEVVIAFENGNPDRPYISGVMHDSAHPDHVNNRNYKRNVLRTPSNNKIRLDDNRGQEHIKISTEYGGKSQLNLGHLVDNEKHQRGEGVELRTDDWVAVRGGKGLLLTSYRQPKAMAQQLSMDEIKGQLSDALALAESLSNVLQTAKIEGLDNRTQQKFLQQNIEQLQQPVIVAGSPGGIALSTPKHIQMSANQNQILTSGGNTEVSALKRMVLAAKTGFVAFAQELGMKLVAAKGKVELQAQTDSMDIFANKGLSITSSEDEIVISAKKKITLQCGGSYVTIDPTKIESGTNGSYLVKSASFNHSGPATMNTTTPKFTACENAASEASEQGDAFISLS